jgi:hypothetical protein
MSEIRSWLRARRRRILLWLLYTTLIACCLISTNRPNPKVTLATGYMSFQGVESCIYTVDVTVKNNGAEGWVTVRCEISSPGMYEMQTKRIYLASRESESLHFEFYIFKSPYTHPEICNISRYRAWTEAH